MKKNLLIALVVGMVGVSAMAFSPVKFVKDSYTKTKVEVKKGFTKVSDTVKKVVHPVKKSS